MYGNTMYTDIASLLPFEPENKSSAVLAIKRTFTLTVIDKHIKKFDDVLVLECF